MKIAIFGNRYQATHLGELRGFLSWLHHNGHEFFIERNFAGYLADNDCQLAANQIVDSLSDDADMVASIGGDGTFLHASDWVGKRQIPIMGINTGHLGYLTGYSFADFSKIEMAFGGEFDLSSRMTIEVSSPYLPEGFSPVALNEVSVSKGDTTSMVEIHAMIDGKYLADYLADGLVISTPTGSTAYNLSCGGPIVEPTLDSFILSPIAPHSLTLRPLVVGPESHLSFEIKSRGSQCNVGVDGRTFVIPADGTLIKVSKAPYRVKVVQPPLTDFASVLRSKLRWGG